MSGQARKTDTLDVWMNGDEVASLPYGIAEPVGDSATLILSLGPKQSFEIPFEERSEQQLLGHL